jgi:hypothetical protein
MGLKDVPSSILRGLRWLIDMYAGTGAAKAGKRKGDVIAHAACSLLTFVWRPSTEELSPFVIS